MICSNKTQTQTMPSSLAPTHFFPTLHTTRPASELIANNTSLGLSVLRNQLSISSWLALGALLQCILFSLPGIRNYLAALPTITLLLYRITLTFLQSYNYIQNPAAEGIIPGHTTTIFPPQSSSSTANDTTTLTPGANKICIVILGARSHHPLGIFALSFKAVGDHFRTLTAHLEANAASTGFLGASTSINASDGGSTSNQLVTILYFRSKEDVSRFAHGAAHMTAWKWWGQAEKEEKQRKEKGWKGHGLDWVGLSHEVFEAERGSWEALYVNMKPTGLGATWAQIEGGKEEGEGRAWKSPVVMANGGLKTSKGRMGGMV